jgi:glycogen synthase
MKLLFTSNFYPPYAVGGYEQWAAEVAEALQQRGHQVLVVTSRVEGESESATVRGVQVARVLNPQARAESFMKTAINSMLHRRKLEAQALEKVRHIVSRFEPDAALIWGMWNVSRAVPALIEQLLPRRVAYYLCDYWLSLPGAYRQYWETPSGRFLTRFPKKLLSLFALRQLSDERDVWLELQHPICVSEALKSRLLALGVPISHAAVMHGGTQTETFVDREPPVKNDGESLKVIYAGRLSREKGIDTVLEAMHLLAQSFDDNVPFTLDIFGNGDPHYSHRLQETVDRFGIGGAVTFHGAVPRDAMPQVYAAHDILVFPSEWEEPFARTLLEAMAAGLVVVGTTSGGSAEILEEGVTGLTFEPGDAAGLARQLRRLTDPDLRLQLARRAKDTVRNRFTFSQMVDNLEAVLVELAKAT